MKGQQRSGRGGVAATGPAELPAETDGEGRGAGVPVHWRRRLGHADLTAVPDVRRALRELLRQGTQCATDVAELLTTELVTNALVHTEHDAEITATVAASRLRVEVRDLVARHPKLHLPIADEGTHGRGLVLVQALADAWGVRAHGVGKVVWFELDFGLDFELDFELDVGGGPA